MTLLRHVQRTAPQTPMILITAYGTVSSAVSAMQSGAMDYLLKPVQFDDLLAKVRKALEFRRLESTCRVLTEQLSAEAVFHNLVGQSRQMLQLFELVRKLSTVKSSVLVVGESGTGKELIARAIHYNGITRDRPFVPVNCGAIPDTLVESELFGYRRGAFTGANQDKMGFFEAADGGTLFLDEISTLRPNVQSSLLRALEERVIVPVGDTRPREAGEELKDAVRLFERQHIINSLQRHGYDKNVTARKLGIGVSSLYRKLDEMNIPKSPDEDNS